LKSFGGEVITILNVELRCAIKVCDELEGIMKLNGNIRLTTTSLILDRNHTYDKGRKCVSEVPVLVVRL
jgi:hypothetical protein